MDIEDHADLQSVREVAFRKLADAEVVVCRFPGSPDPTIVRFLPHSSKNRLVAALQNAENGLKVVPLIGLGSPGRVSLKPQIERQIIEEARAAELLALVARGDGIWTPKDFHYVLPSGAHAASFVKIGSAIRSPHDAACLASWLQVPSSEGSGLIIDTGHLSALALALMSEPRNRFVSLSVLDEYPSTDSEVRHAVSRALNHGARRIVAIVSVSASGQLVDRLMTALLSCENVIDRWEINIMIDRVAVESRSSKISEKGQIVRWAILPETALGVERCNLCAQADSSTPVPIDPRTFEHSYMSLLDRRTPSVPHAADNREFWTFISKHNCVSLDAMADDHVRSRRPRDAKMPVKIEFNAQLFADGAFRTAVATRLAEHRAGSKKDLKISAPNLILVADAETRRDGFSSFVASVQSTIFGRTLPVMEFPHDGEWSTALTAACMGAREIAFFSCGVVTGETLRHALHRLQQIRRGSASPYQVSAFVVHLRPQTIREAETFANVFAHRVWRAWETTLPAQSPLAAESELLDRLDPNELESDDARDFWDARREYCTHPDQRSPFWAGDGLGPVTPNSLFGDALSAPTVYAAVSSSIEHKRQERVPAPLRAVFEMPAICRSYYDALILVSMFRWFSKSEMWWGDRPDQPAQIISELIDRVRINPDMQKMLIAELLLAAGMRKIPASGIRALLSLADRSIPCHQVGYFMAKQELDRAVRLTHVR